MVRLLTGWLIRCDSARNGIESHVRFMPAVWYILLEALGDQGTTFPMIQVARLPESESQTPVAQESCLTTQAKLLLPVLQ